MHNLRGLDVDVPRDKLVVITGLSGSGKSSLAFDTIYAEGQRRYVESLSAYARQFLGQMDKPAVDSIDGLSPAISIDQKTTSRNPRSTVATVTEIHDYLRLLWARAGVAHCHICNQLIAAQSTDQITEQILEETKQGDKFMLTAPLVRGRKGQYEELLERLRSEGFSRVRVDGQIFLLEEEIKIDKQKRHDISVVVDRLVRREDMRRRLADAVETASLLGEGLVGMVQEDGQEILFSEAFACSEHGAVLPELEPRIFSFNSPHGACEKCSGLGFLPAVDPDLVILPERSIAEGAILPWAQSDADFWRQLEKALVEHFSVSIDTPFKKLPAKVRKGILEGVLEPLDITYERAFGPARSRQIQFKGVVADTERRYSSASEWTKGKLEQFIRLSACSACKGKRLKPQSCAVLVAGTSLPQLSAMSVDDALQWTSALALPEAQKHFAAPIIKEISERLSFLKDVGVGYLSMDRASGTLSGGESQRLRLATQIGSALTGVLYVLDEPSIGLHQRDNDRLIATLERLRDLGNTVLVVEHDEQTMRAADQVIDLGPGAGEDGGRLMAQGTAAQISRVKKSPTGAYLSGRKSISRPSPARQGSGTLEIIGASGHNLKSLDVIFPLGAISAISGVSGSGKSTLVTGTVLPALRRQLMGQASHPLPYKAIKGVEQLDKVIGVDQAPIGRTPRSNAATYIGLFDVIRDLFSKTKESRSRGYKPGRFSFNVQGGRCETGKGDGVLTIEMHFLPDVEVPCEACLGKRYNRETLEVRYKGKTIAEVLEMPVSEACKFFSAITPAKRRLDALDDVGLGYLKLGQPATTLSGGEAQRVKLAAELSKVATGKTLYVLDEPTTGLHFADVDKLLKVLDRLAASGNTVLVIEHNLDVIKCADWVVDLGPEGGQGGGKLIRQGTPQQIANSKKSQTGLYLRPLLPVK